ncbi:hypothetical protein LQZ18_13020 [Lachnospiraceae bacterium ZAX-1]
MGLFKRKKKPEDMGNYLDGASSEKSAQGKKEAARQVRQYALNYCGQMMQSAKELQETKKEYKNTEKYLTDIRTIEKMPPEKLKTVKESAQSVAFLTKTRDDYVNKAKKITDAQFAQMQQLEEEIPDAIKRLEANESYQGAVKRDMQYLEGEKGEWSYYLTSLGQEQILLKRLFVCLFVAFTAVLAALLVLNLNFRTDVHTPLVITIFIVAAIGGLAFLRMQNNAAELKKSGANINRAISLMNSVKMRYVSVTNAVNYACEKFHVNNAYELNYIWEQYLEAVQEQEQQERNSDDLEYFSRKLMRDLRPLKLHDQSVWSSQVNALVDKNEMITVKRDYITRCKTLRSQIEEQIKSIQDVKVEIELLLISKNNFDKDILDVLNAIDNICRMKWDGE